MPLTTPPVKNIKEVTEPLKEEIYNGNVHTIDEMRTWLKPLGYSDTINEAAIKFVLREFVMREVSTDNMREAPALVVIDKLWQMVLPSAYSTPLPWTSVSVG